MPESENTELIERFYGAFNEHDGDVMAASYAPDAHFWDPVFGDLRGDEPGAMWRMLTGRAEDLTVDLAEHEVGDDRGSAHWIARYTFAQTGRAVTNDIHASFRFAGGLIADHRDEFSFHRWARQALGASGLLLGWTPFLHSAVSRRARAGLDEFMAGATASG
ncbi:MAG: nuclear transport factor 2 family protein [Solirubrobacterales bacterium]